MNWWNWKGLRSAATILTTRYTYNNFVSRKGLLSFPVPSSISKVWCVNWNRSRFCSTTKSNIKQCQWKENNSRIHKILFEIAGYNDSELASEFSNVVDADNSNSEMETQTTMEPITDSDSDTDRYRPTKGHHRHGDGHVRATIKTKKNKIRELSTSRIDIINNANDNFGVLSRSQISTSKNRTPTGTGIKNCKDVNASSNLQLHKPDGIIFWEKLKSLENMNDHKQILDLFDRSDFEQRDLSIWPSRLIAGTILHSCLQQEKFGELLELYNKFISSGLEPGGGIYVTLIKCYAKMKEWGKAIEIIQDKTARGLLRNVRVYPFLIKELIVDDQMEHAFMLFADMEKQELVQRQKDQVNDQKMLAAFVNIASKNRNRKKDISQKIFQGILDYMRSRGLMFSAELCAEITKWFSIEKEITLQVVDIPSELAICPNCCQSLKENDTLDRNCIEVIYLGIQSAFAKSSEQQQASEEFYTIQRLLEERDPFQVVIDAANVMNSNSHIRNDSKKVSKPELLSSIVKDATCSGNHVCILMTRSLFEIYKEDYREDIRELSTTDRVEIIVLDKLNDDLTLLYVALASERKLLNQDPDASVKIITNDFMRDHMFCFTDSFQWELIKWFRLRQIKFEWNWQNIPILHELKIDPILHVREGTYHLPQVDGKWLCITKSENNTDIKEHSV